MAALAEHGPNSGKIRPEPGWLHTWPQFGRGRLNSANKLGQDAEAKLGLHPETSRGHLSGTNTDQHTANGLSVASQTLTHPHTQRTTFDTTHHHTVHQIAAFVHIAICRSCRCALARWHTPMLRKCRPLAEQVRAATEARAARRQSVDRRRQSVARGR